jgi:hypothetical protein
MKRGRISVRSTRDMVGRKTEDGEEAEKGPWRDGGMEGWRDGGMEGWRDGGWMKMIVCWVY